MFLILRFAWLIFSKIPIIIILISDPVSMWSFLNDVSVASLSRLYYIYILEIKARQRRPQEVLAWGLCGELAEIRVQWAGAGSVRWKSWDEAMGLENEGATICLAWARAAFGRPSKTNAQDFVIQQERPSAARLSQATAVINSWRLWERNRNLICKCISGTFHTNTH